VLVLTNATSPSGAGVSIIGNSLTYDPSQSAFLNGLGPGQTNIDIFSYIVMDGSFIFANDDFFKVVARRLRLYS